MKQNAFAARRKLVRERFIRKFCTHSGIFEGIAIVGQAKTWYTARVRPFTLRMAE